MSEDSISSLGQNIWGILAVSKVNSLTPSQLSGLASSQLSDLTNSPNYALFSSSVRNYAASALDPTRTVSTVSVDPNAGSSADLVNFNVVVLALSLGLALILTRL